MWYITGWQPGIRVRCYKNLHLFLGPTNATDFLGQGEWGLKLLRSVIARNVDKVVYIQIGATWCPATRYETPFQREMAEAYKGQPLRIVNFYLDNGSDGTNPFATNIETYNLTDEQRLGLDPILHNGRGIPFYILINKDGIIVDFGEHLRPSMPETQTIIDKYIQN